MLLLLLNNFPSTQSVTVVTAGVVGIAAVGSAVAKASSIPLVTGLASSGYVGTVIVVGKASVGAVGVSASGSVGTLVVRFPFTQILTGVASTGQVGTSSVVGKGRVYVTGVSGTTVAGVVVIRAKSRYSVVGVASTGLVGSPLVKINYRAILSGVSASSNIGNVSVTVTIFNYQNIANLYSRVRTIFVERTTTTKDRTINIEAQNRTVYINDKPISFSRTVYT